MRVILLNGPPRSGKSTLAKELQTYFGEDRCAIIGFSYHLKRMVHAIYGLPGDTDVEVFDSIKDTSSPIFLGLSPRQAYIMWSEKAAKMFHGKDFFGRMFLRAAEANGHELIIVPDSGFREEAISVAERVGPDNVYLVHLNRRGTTFENDSRNFIDLADVNVFTWQAWNCEDHIEMPLCEILDGARWAFGNDFVDGENV